MATYALCEAYGMTKNPNCKEAAQTCLYRIVENQSSTGGWDYKVNKNSTRDDLSFAGWAIQALKAGKMAGLHPEGLQTAINKAINCLKKRSYSKSAGFTYTPTNGNNGGSTGLAGVGTLAMQLLGRGSEPEALNALDVMRDWKPSYDPDGLSAKKPGGSPQYYCYYATQCREQGRPHVASVHGHLPHCAPADGVLPLPPDDVREGGRGRGDGGRRGREGDGQVERRQRDC